MNRQQRLRRKIQAAMIQARLKRLAYEGHATDAERERLERTLQELTASPGDATVYPAAIRTTQKG